MDLDGSLGIEGFRQPLQTECQVIFLILATSRFGDSAMMQILCLLKYKTVIIK